MVNTLAASAGYWLAAACDEIVVSPSGSVGSVGVFVLHEDHGAELEAQGVSFEFVYRGARKVERHPFGPLDDVSRAALQEVVDGAYDTFTKAVSKFRGASLSIVRADPGRIFQG